MKMNSDYRLFIAGNDVEHDSKVVVKFGPRGDYKRFETSNFANEISFNVSKFF